MSHHLQAWLDAGRELTTEERAWLGRLLSQDFPGRDILMAQLQDAQVIGYCPCGCRSVNFKVPHERPAFPFAERIPVEMLVDYPPYFLFLLHVVEGYVDELEVIRGDSQPIHGPIPIEDARVTIYVAI